MRIAHLLSAGLVGLSLSTITSVSQETVEIVCEPDGPGMLRQAEKDGKRPDATAFTASGKLVFVLVDPDGRYSIITIAPDNEGCLISVGTGWESLR